jgi:hypothetical protein
MKPSHQWQTIHTRQASGAKAVVFQALDVAAEAATHKTI